MTRRKNTEKIKVCLQLQEAKYHAIHELDTGLL